MNDEQNIISERIHDADSEINENMVHWLHAFFRGKVQKEDLEKVFNYAYKDQKLINPPWEKLLHS